MNMLKDVYITSMGNFLPGEPVSNDEMEDYLGKIGGIPSRAKARVLKQNGIKFRYYAIDKQQQTLFSNAEMAAHAIRDAIDHTTVSLSDVDFLAVATSQGDLPLPGFGSMVHGQLDLPACEIATFHGVCASGMMAFKDAFLQVASGEKKTAICCASEFASRLFKATRFEAQAPYRNGSSLPFDTEFLRWMLSDGAGAALLREEPSRTGLSLKIEWITIKSHAHQFEPCMYVGPPKDESGVVRQSWLDYPSYQAAADATALNLRQDLRMLGDVVTYAVDGLFELIEEGRLHPEDIDWLACHYSSHIFKDRAYELLQRGGLTIPKERWFTNLYTKGNTGAASIYIMLEELLNEDRLAPGQRIVCVVPESGRFIFSYMLLTVVEGLHQRPRIPSRSIAMFQAPTLQTSGSPLEEKLVRQLTRVWIDFETRLNKVPIVEKLNRGKFTLHDYKTFLFNLRQQVIDGSRWIARAASNITRHHFPLRSAFISHTSDEHRDFEMLEQNYVSVGGSLEEIQAGKKNIGSEALSAWIMHRASRENPFDLVGTMFIIEGLGQRVAYHWGTLIRDQLNLTDEQVSFFLYHAVSDDYHFERLDLAIQSGILTDELVATIVKTAKVTARLYLLQLEELDNF